jgi:hypothetical protein
VSLDRPSATSFRPAGAAHRPGRSAAPVVALVLLATVVLRDAPAPATAAAGPRIGPNEPVTPTDLVARTANNSPLLVADPTEPRFVVLANRLDGPDFGCALQVSGDGGFTVAPL